MALSSINFQAQEQANKVVLGAAGLVKVASLATGTLGEVAALGVASGVNVSWSLVGNPGSAITLSAKAGDPTKATLDFTAVPIRTDPYLLVIQASTPDGASAQIPLAVLVREPLMIREVSRPNDAAITISGKTYDDSLQALTFQGIGPGGAATDVHFLPPAGLPQGLQFGVGDGGAAYLTPSVRTYQDPAGGIQTDQISATVAVRAFRPGTLYDTPDTPAEIQVTYDLSPGPKTTSATIALGAAFDITSRGLGVDAHVAFVGGKPQTYTLDWSLSAGATGAWVQAPTSSTLSAVWKPSGTSTQDVSVTVKVLGAGGVELATATAGPFKVSGKDPSDAAPANNWTTSAAVPVQIAPTRLYPQDSGKHVYYRVSLPDLATGETAQVTTQVVAVGSAGAISDVPAAATILASSSKDVVLGITLPSDAFPGQMWAVQVVVSVTGGTLPRTGFAQILAVALGAPTLVVTPSTLTASGGTGDTLSPITLRAHTWVQKDLPATPTDAFLSPVPSVANSDLTEVQGVSFRAMAAPAGVSPAYSSGSGFTQLTGTLYSAGTSTINVAASRQGYTPGVTSSPILMTVTSQVAPVTFTSFSSSNPQVTTGQGFTLYWGHSGSGTIQLQRGDSAPVDVSGSLSSAQLPITSPTPFILRGSNALQESFSSPVLVTLGSAGSATQLPPSPTIASIDDHNRCIVAWEPVAISGSTAAYDHWKITLKDSATGSPAVAPGAAKVTGLETGFGGTDRARAFEFTTTAGYHEMSMQAYPATLPGETILESKPWDTYKVFPGVRVVSLDKDTVSLGESLAVSVGDVDSTTGAAGDRWKAVYSDGTASDWFPMALTSVAKSFTAPGEQTITILVQSDYSTSSPAVKLQRSMTLKVFVQDQDYQGSSSTLNPTNASVGLGGEAGFDITTDLKSEAVLQPFLVLVPAIVRDVITNELKLMVATARTRDASSVLGTMAVDVFSLAGHPHSLDLLQTRGVALASESNPTYELVKITTDALPDWIVGQTHAPVQLQVKEGSGVAPYKWFATGLPQGLTLNVDGTLMGTVMSLGSYTINVSVQDSQTPPSLDERTYTLAAKSDLTIQTPSTGSTAPSAATVGSDYAFRFSAQKGVAPYLWAVVAGSLPQGLSLQADGSLVGTAETANSSDDFDIPSSFVVQVVDAVGAKASRQFTIALSPQTLRVCDPDQSEVFLGQQSKIRTPVVGGRPGYTLVSASAPQGLLKAPVSLVNGVLEAWMSEAYTTTEDNVSIQVHICDAAGTELTTTLSWKVRSGIPVPRWIAASVDSWVDGADGSAGKDVRAYVGGALSGVDYSSITLRPSLLGATTSTSAADGLLEIKRPVTSPQNQEILVEVVVAQGAYQMAKVAREYSIQTVSHVGSTRTWTVKALPVRVGEFFAFDVSAPALNPPPALPLAATQRMRVADGSSLPSGVSLNAINGMVYGKFKAAGSPRTLLEVVTGATVDSTVTVEWTVVGSALTIRGALPSVEVGQLYGGPTGQALTVTGAVGAITASLIHGRLPEGLTMSVVQGSTPSVKFSGRPLETGYFDLSIRVSDYSGQTGFYRTRLFVAYLPYLAGVTASLPKVVTGFTYAPQTLKAQGGKPDYTWALATGSPALPDGIVLSTAGVLTGKSTATGYNADVVFEVTDAYGQTARLTLNMQVGAADPLLISTTTLPSGLVGTPYIGAQLQSTGGVPAFAWSSGTLPDGMHLDATTGMITGTPTAPFNQSVSFTVTDALNVTRTQAIQLVVEAAGDFRVTTTSIPAGRVGQVYTGGGSNVASLRNSGADTPVRVAGNHVPVKLSGKSYILAVGGDVNLRGTGSSSPLPALPYLFDPDVVTGGTRTGSWAPANWPMVTDPSVSGAVNVSPWNLTDRFFSAAVPLSDTEFVLIGGAAMGVAYTSTTWTGNPGRSIGPLTEVSSDPIPQSLWPIVFVKIMDVNGTRSLSMIPGPQIPTAAQGGNTSFHAAAATRIDTSRVMFMGGIGLTLQHASASDGFSQAVAANVTGREAYIMQLAASRRSSVITRVSDMPVALMCSKAVTLKDGRVMVVGGLVRNGAAVVDAAGSTTCLLYNPTTDAWSNGPALPTKEYGQSLVQLADGRVIYGGGSDFYIMDAAATAWTLDITKSGYGPNNWGGMTLLSDGNVLFMQGTDNAVVNEGQGVLIPDMTIQDTLSAYLGAFRSSYTFSAAPAAQGTYFLSPGTAGGGAPGYFLTAEGGVRPYGSWTASSPIPGLSLNALTGLLSGTPTEGFDSLVSFTATDSTQGTPKVTTPKSLRVTMVDPNAPVWVTSALPEGHLEEAYSYQLVAKDVSGSVLSGTYTLSPFSNVGLPSGITLSASGALTGVTSSRGSRSVTIRVTQPGYPTRFTDHEFTLNFTCNTRITTTQLPQATATLPFSATLAVAGGRAPYTWTVASGSLPSGLSLNASTGAITGTVAAQADKDVDVTFNVADPNGCTASTTLRFAVRNVTLGISISTDRVIQGDTYEGLLSASGGQAPYSWSVNGLPAGFGLRNPTADAAILAWSDATTSTALGTYPVNVTCTDAQGLKTTQVINLKVTAPDFTWKSGPQMTGAWAVRTGATSDEFIPVAMVWERLMVECYHASYDAYYLGAPWTIVVSGAFKTTTPTLNPGVAGLTATLLTINSDKTQAVFALSYSGTGIQTLRFAPTLSDGATTLQGPTFGVEWQPSTSQDFQALEKFIDAAGATGDSSYTMQYSQGVV